MAFVAKDGGGRREVAWVGGLLRDPNERTGPFCYLLVLVYLVRLV